MRLRHTHPNLGRAGRLPLAVEALEARDCPSTLALQGTTLLIADAGAAHTNDKIIIRDDGHGDVNVSLTDGSGHTKTLAAHGVVTIQVNTGAENDTIDYALTGALTTSRQLLLNPGAGNDQTSLDFTRGASAPNLTVRYNEGNGEDTLNALFGAIQNSNVDFRNHLGDGNDQVFARFNGGLLGTAKVYFQTTCGNGIDGVNVSVSGNIGAAAALQVDSNGGAAMDVFHVDYQGQLNGKLTINTVGGPTYSWIQSNITVLAGSTGSLQAHLTGHGDGDLMILQLNDLSHHLATLNATLTGGPDDVGIATSNVLVAGGISLG
jgi:hypothetical protein